MYILSKQLQDSIDTEVHWAKLPPFQRAKTPISKGKLCPFFQTLSYKRKMTYISKVSKAKICPFKKSKSHLFQKELGVIFNQNMYPGKLLSKKFFENKIIWGKFNKFKILQTINIWLKMGNLKNKLA